MYWHSFASSNSSGHKPLGKTEIPNSQLGISVIPTSPQQGISGNREFFPYVLQDVAHNIVNVDLAVNAEMLKMMARTRALTE